MQVTIGNQYAWKSVPGHPFKGDAQIIGEHVEQLVEQAQGRLTPTVIVEDARSPVSPLHPSFEWNDLVAAELHRQDTARALMQSIVVVKIQNHEITTPVRAFVSVIADDKQHYYTPITVAMNDVALRDQVLRQAWRELQSWRKKYEEYKEFAQVIEAIGGIALPMAA